MKTKIIGTGLSGLVGSRIVELLGDKFEFIDFSLDKGIDILNKDSLSQAFGSHQDAAAVIHLAAFTDTNAAWEQRGDKSGLCYQLNVVGTENVLDLAKKNHQYFIYISTDFVFDGTKTTPYVETDTPHPIEWYGETKYIGEQVILNSRHPSAITRITYPYRAKFDQKPDIIHKVLTKLQSGDIVKMFADQICTYTFIDDVALALGQFLDKKYTGIYHLVGSSSHSPYDMSRLVAQTFGYDLKLVQPSSLQDYINSQPAGSRPWQQTLITSNQKVVDLGIHFKTLTEGLTEIKTQLSL